MLVNVRVVSKTWVEKISDSDVI